jgi:hypothetical protein
VSSDIVERMQTAIDRLTQEGTRWLTIDALKDGAAEIERLRAAIDAVLAELGTDHQPNSDGRGCIWCFPRDGSWPCVHRMVLDELIGAHHDR